MIDPYYCAACGIITRSDTGACFECFEAAQPCIEFLRDITISRECKVNALEEFVPFAGEETLARYFRPHNIRLPQSPHVDAPDAEWRTWYDSIITAVMEEQ